MKNRNWIYPVLIVLCLLVYGGYRVVDRMNSDTRAPEIEMNEELLQVSVQAPREELLGGVSAKDDRDGDVMDSLVVEGVRLLGSDGRALVSFAAFDQAGNVAKGTREVQFSDYESPKFKLSGPLLFAQNSGFDVLSGITVEDALDGDISHRIRATVLDDRSVSTLGIQNVQFRVTNSLGDTVELVLPVEVYASGSFEAELALTEYLVYLPVGSAFDANSYLSYYRLSRETVSLKNGVPSDMTLKINGQVDTQTPGVYTVDYTVTSWQGELTYTGYSKLIVVVEG